MCSLDDINYVREVTLYSRESATEYWSIDERGADVDCIGTEYRGDSETTDQDTEDTYYSCECGERLDEFYCDADDGEDCCVTHHIAQEPEEATLEKAQANPVVNLDNPEAVSEALSKLKKG